MFRKAVVVVQDKINAIVYDYYKNDAYKLHNLADRVLKGLKFHDVDKSEYYSIANEVFVKIIKRYNPDKQDFNGYLYACLRNKFKSEMTASGRHKRIANKNAVSVYDGVSNDDTNVMIIDTIADKRTIEKEIFEEKENGYSDKMVQYLGRLSKLQRDVLRLLSIGYKTREIIEELHIDEKTYEDCHNAIHAYRNVSVLL